MFPSKFRIARVDMNGYNGRENHPELSDVGLTVTAVKMEAFYSGPEFAEEPVLGDDDGRLVIAALPVLSAADNYIPAPDGEDDRSVTWFVTVVTEDGRVLDMVDFELDPL